MNICLMAMDHTLSVLANLPGPARASLQVWVGAPGLIHIGIAFALPNVMRLGEFNHVQQGTRRKDLFL